MGADFWPAGVTIAVVRDAAQTFLRNGRGYRRPVVTGTFFSFTFADPVPSLMGRLIQGDAQPGRFPSPL